MEKEDIENLSRLLTDMKEAVYELENSMKKNNFDLKNTAKRKILELQIQIDKSI